MEDSIRMEVAIVLPVACYNFVDSRCLVAVCLCSLLMSSCERPKATLEAYGQSILLL